MGGLGHSSCQALACPGRPNRHLIDFLAHESITCCSTHSRCFFLNFSLNLNRVFATFYNPMLQTHYVTFFSIDNQTNDEFYCSLAHLPTFTRIYLLISLYLQPPNSPHRMQASRQCTARFYLTHSIPSQSLPHHAD